MFCRKIAFFALLIYSSLFFAQTKNSEWQLGVGASITKFGNSSDVDFIGDRYQFQVPRFNITAPITDNISFDTAISVNTFDFGIIENSAFYFSVDLTGRYHFELAEWFFPYVLAGASMVDSSLNISPTLNIGAGTTFWVNNLYGINIQTYYKHSFEASKGMRSHFQFTAGMVFAIDLYDLLIFGRLGKVCF